MMGLREIMTSSTKSDHSMMQSESSAMSCHWRDNCVSMSRWCRAVKQYMKVISDPWGIKQSINQPFCWPPTCNKEMSKKERENSDQVTSRDGKFVLVKWYDNHHVTLAFNCCSGPRRWSLEVNQEKNQVWYPAPRGCEEIQPGHGWSRQAWAFTEQKQKLSCYVWLPTHSI